MSATLMWEPKKRKAQSLPDALKFILRDSLGAGMGWQGGRITFNHSNDAYLRGLRDAGIEGAQELLDAIEQHEEVELWLEY